MTCRRRAAAALAVSLFWFGSPLAAQAVGTVDIGASVVEYDGFLVSGAAVLSPALRFVAPNLSVGGQGSWTMFETGNRILQGTVGAAWLTPAREWWRVELSGSLGIAAYADQPTYGHALARTRVHLFGARAGGWAGASTGGSFDGTAEAPLELELGAWSVRDRVALVGTLTGARRGADRYVDLLGAVRWTSSWVELEARGGVRPWVEGGQAVGEPRTGGYGDLSARLAFTERIALVLSGGSYPSDPVRRVLGAKYVTAALHLTLVGSERTPQPTFTGTLERAARHPAPAPDVSEARLEIAASGYPAALRVYVPNAESVDVMGDFTDWQTVALRRVSATVWEIRVALSSGVHRVNVRIDGGRWLAPAGTRVEQSEFGGTVGVVVIP